MTLAIRSSAPPALALAALLLLASAGPGAAQDQPRIGQDGFRQGVPGVLSPPRPPRPPQPAPETPFASAYRRAGSPRLILFFNRDISAIPTSEARVQRRDIATLERDGRLTLREQAPAAPATTVERPPLGQSKSTLEVQAQPDATAPGETGPRQVEVGERLRLQSERRTEVTVERQAFGARNAPMDEGSQWLFETGFTRRLATERVRMVDRATALRISTAARSVLDPQQLETAAIREHAEVVVLVRAAPMQAAPGGSIYRVTAVDLRRGTILADEVITPPAVEPGQLAASSGDLAAAALMLQLQSEWSPPR
ncbi:hypothetical protein [Falsiroseomonas sp.]|uniref:hypothetical protein n=1 Tax=Falsiroseomonas sp. TaxID=2870721 RepID=UPI003F6F36A7